MATPQWRKDLRPASFRGVPFKVASSERQGGRRSTQHEYPQRNKPFTEDLGRKGKGFQLDGYVIGLNYMPDRDKLISALEDESGSGELIHPYYGRLLVNCIDFRVRETSQDGGMAVFSMTFVESGEDTQPALSSDPRALVNQSTASAIEAQKDIFAQIFSVAGLPNFVVESATTKVTAFADAVDSVLSSLPSRTDTVADLAYSIRQLRANTLALVKQPSQLADNMADSMKLLRESTDDFRDVFTGLSSFFGFGSADKPIDQTTSTREAQATNATALDDFVKVVAVSEAANAAAEIEFENIEDANSIRQTLTDQIDALLDASTNDETFIELQDLRTQITKAVPPPDESLPSISKVTPMVTSPSLVLTYDLYENADREQDLIDRNEIRHPGFIVGGAPLEVLEVE